MRSALRFVASYVHSQATSRCAWPTSGTSTTSPAGTLSRGATKISSAGFCSASASIRRQRSPSPEGRPSVGSDRFSTSSVSSCSPGSAGHVDRPMLRIECAAHDPVDAQQRAGARRELHPERALRQRRPRDERHRRLVLRAAFEAESHQRSDRRQPVVHRRAVRLRPVLRIEDVAELHPYRRCGALMRDANAERGRVGLPRAEHGDRLRPEHLAAAHESRGAGASPAAAPRCRGSPRRRSRRRGRRRSLNRRSPSRARSRRADRPGTASAVRRAPAASKSANGSIGLLRYARGPRRTRRARRRRASDRALIARRRSSRAAAPRAPASPSRRRRTCASRDSSRRRRGRRWRS